MGETEGKVITVGVTGASGAILAQATLRLLEADPRVARVHLMVTETGLRLFAHELSIVPTDAKQLPALILRRASRKLELPPNKDVGASIASAAIRWMPWS